MARMNRFGPRSDFLSSSTSSPVAASSPFALLSASMERLPAGVGSTSSAHRGTTSISSVGSGGSSPSRTSTTITVMLSRPPASLAWSTRRSAASCGSVRVVIVSRMSGSATSSTRPSLQSRNRSPRMRGSVHQSTLTSGSMPRARVMMLRRGWVRASSSVMWPVDTNSCT